MSPKNIYRIIFGITIAAIICLIIFGWFFFGEKLLLILSVIIFLLILITYFESRVRIHEAMLKFFQEIREQLRWNEELYQQLIHEIHHNHQKQTIAVLQMPKEESFLRKEINRLDKYSKKDAQYHIKRYLLTLHLLPDKRGKLLEIGTGYSVFTRLLKKFRRYNIITTELTPHNIYYTQSIKKVDYSFNIETDQFPFRNNTFKTVLLMEVIEHLTIDPMHALSEINRTLQKKGYLLLTTPNSASWASIHRALNQENPNQYPFYRKGKKSNQIHSREYVINEVKRLVDKAGFKILSLFTVDVYDGSLYWMPIKGYKTTYRGDTIFCLCQKITNVKERYPTWLYH